VQGKAGKQPNTEGKLVKPYLKQKPGRNSRDAPVHRDEDGADFELPRWI